jgi:adenylate cyclase
MVEPIGFLIVGLFAIGMALSFLAADPHSPTSRPLCLLLGALGVSLPLNIPATGGLLLGRSLWIRTFSFLELVTLAAAFEWILRIGRTEVSTEAETTSGERLLRMAQGLACLYGLAGMSFPTLRDQVWNVPSSLPLLHRSAFHLFAVPFNLSLALAGVRLVQLLRARLDPAERLRLVALMFAAPFWCAAIFLPPAWKPPSVAIGEVIFLAGAIRYHVLQGQRGQFLARFLSPQVVRLVRERGLASTMQQSRTELSVVACDLRGFTAFTETAAPEEIMKLLEEYYGAVGEVVVGFGGSISNFAGDGILALVGAPVAQRDHAARAVGMALEIGQRVDTLLSRWRDLGLHLGIGVGVASGFVTVGVIGGGARLEYTAVGPAVNLASRLCARAEAGQVLADPRVVGSVGDAGAGYRFAKLETAELKGFARPITIFSVAADGGRAEAPGGARA